MLKYLLIAFVLLVSVFILLYPKRFLQSLNLFKSRSQSPSQSSSSPTVPSSGIALGVYEPAADLGNPLTHGTAVDQYTQELGKKPAFAWFSVRWQNANTGQYNQFDPAILEQYRTRGIMPGLNWDPSKGEGLKNTDQPEFSWKAIASGEQDTYIRQVAASVSASYPYPFLMRPFAEMDGNYYPWGYNANGNTNPADFVAAWRHVVDIFRKAGATKVQFVWCQRANDQKIIDGNTNGQKNSDLLRQLYPGDDYVDWIALDGYVSYKNNWRSLQDEFQPSYDLLTNLSARPMIFYEVGATENPADPIAKANWITQGFLTTIPTQFPAVKAVNWMNAKNSWINPGTKNDADWAVDTSQNALNAWKQVVTSPLYQGSLFQ